MGSPSSQTGWSWLMANGRFNTTPLEYAQHGADHMIWQQLMTGGDEMRKRVALAWTEILVVSTSAIDGEAPSFAMAAYWDLLNQHVFGNFRTLLGEITLNPAMGRFLNTLNNLKEDASKGRYPDENYAREVMQLFTIGLHQLNRDGTLKLSGGKPIETYNQNTVSNLARVFTGYRLDTTGHVRPSNPLQTRNPMRLDDARHSKLDVNFLGTTIAGNTPGPQKLKLALDALFAHPNVAPFICKQLIQRLVTSNPSSAYVDRVAAVFENNGAGVRGDLKATTQAILLDSEARQDPTRQGPSWGKVREPMVRMAQWARTFGVTSKTGNWEMWDASDNLGQSPLRSESVFNFFRPGYVPPKTAIASAGLAAPEFQIVNESTLASTINATRAYLLGWTDAQCSYSQHLALAADPAQLVAQLNLTLTANQLSAKTVQLITDTVSKSVDAKQALLRVQMATFLIMVCPEYTVQK
jgi:uncharacterized protein (DUF1800 family)